MDAGLALDDGLLMDDVGAWCEDKYKLVSLYLSLFATGMKFKWEKRVYIDLYAGAGISRIRGTARLALGSPLIALTTTDPFDLYIFCDSDEAKLHALKQRAQKMAGGLNIQYVVGDCNSTVNTICDLIPRATPDGKVLSLCFADPYDIGIRFTTVKKLCKRFVDFLVLLAVYMDANRAYVHYLKKENNKVGEFLGLHNWRELWDSAKQTLNFPDFLAQQYAKQMTQLGYLDQPLYKMKRVRSNEKNLLLYRLALFSRNERAYRFWDEVLKYSTDQTEMF